MGQTFPMAILFPSYFLPPTKSDYLALSHNRVIQIKPSKDHPKLPVLDSEELESNVQSWVINKKILVLIAVSLTDYSINHLSFLHFDIVLKTITGINTLKICRSYSSQATSQLQSVPCKV